MPNLHRVVYTKYHKSFASEPMYEKYLYLKFYDELGEIMKIEGNNFYLLEVKDSKWIFSTEEEAIEQMKKVAKGNNPENIHIFEVDCSGKEWKIKQVSWAKIAMMFMEGKQ